MAAEPNTRQTNPATQGPAPALRGDVTLSSALGQLRRRVMRSANVAIDMLEASLHAVWNADHLVAEQVRLRDDAVDDEEVWIEQECLRLLTLHRPYGQDFRLLTFCMKVNSDIERVADHATSIAKIAQQVDPDDQPMWPTALIELGDRVPMLCQTLLRAVLDEDVEAARRLVAGDKVIDTLDKRLFLEVNAWIAKRPGECKWALLSYRMGRELERVGDIMANIAEDIVYLATGRIIRHQRVPAAAPPTPPPPPAAAS